MHIIAAPSGVTLHGLDCRIPEQIVAEIGRAKAEEAERTFVLYDVSITVSGDSDPLVIYLAYRNAFYCSAPKIITAHPGPEHLDPGTPEARRREVEAVLASQPSLAFADEIAWREFAKGHADPCGYAQLEVAYADRLARYLQARLSAGGTLDEALLPASFDVDFDGVRRLALKTAIDQLYRSWVFGAEVLSLAIRERLF